MWAYPGSCFVYCRPFHITIQLQCWILVGFEPRSQNGHDESTDLWHIYIFVNLFDLSAQFKSEFNTENYIGQENQTHNQQL